MNTVLRGNRIIHSPRQLGIRLVLKDLIVDMSRPGATGGLQLITNQCA